MQKAANENPWKHGLAASMAASVTSFFTTPFDVVKTRLQVQCSHPTASSAPTIRYHGLTDTFRKVIRYDGFPALWRGLGPTLLMQIPSMGVYVAAYTALRTRLLAPDCGVSPVAAPFYAGLLARTAAATVTCPAELLKTNLQARHGREPVSALDVLRRAVRDQGWRSLWTGLGPTLLRDVPFSGIFWFSYEHGKTLLTEWIPRVEVALRISSNPATTRVAIATDSSTPLAQLTPLTQLTQLTLETSATSETLATLKPTVEPSTVDPASSFASKSSQASSQSYQSSPMSSQLSDPRQPTTASIVDAETAMGADSEMTLIAEEYRSPPVVWMHSSVPFVSAAVAGTIAAVLTNPVDVIKSRRQASLLGAPVGSIMSSRSNHTVRALFRQLIAQEGIRGLTFGLAARVGRTAPACAITLGCYESFRELLS